MRWWVFPIGSSWFAVHRIHTFGNTLWVVLLEVCSEISWELGAMVREIMGSVV